MRKTLLEKQWKYSWILAILITTVVFFPVLNNDWVNWDDGGYVLHNSLVKSINSKGIKAIFTEWNVVGNYHPITVFSLAIDYAIDGFNPMVFHSHNLFLHLFNVLLVFLLISKLFDNYRMSFFVAILFGIHPLHLEPVAWVSSRKDLLYSFYLLLGLLTYLKYINTKDKRKKLSQYSLCLLLFICSLLSKSMAIVFPVFLLLIDYLKHRLYNKKFLLEKAPFFLISLIFVCITFYTQNLEGAIVQDSYLSVFQRAAVACNGFIVYALKAFVPFQLSPFHPYPFQTAENFPFLFYVGLIIIPLLFVLFRYSKNRILVFGSFFFLVSLLPVLQIIPVGRAMMAERYTYIAYIGLFSIVAFYMEQLAKRLSNSNVFLLRIGQVFYLVILIIITHHQTSIWKNGNSLWSEVIKQYPNDYFAYFSRADYFVKTGNPEAALTDLNKSIQLYPNFSKSFNLRGQLFNKKNETEAAIIDFKKAIEADSNLQAPYLNISQILGNNKRFDEALKYLNLAVKKFPNYPSVFLNKGVIHEKLNQPQDALSCYSMTIELDENNGIYYRYRGVFYLGNEQIDMAIIDLNKAIELLKTDGLSYFLRAQALKQKHLYINALKDARMARKYGYQIEEKFIIELKLKVE